MINWSSLILIKYRILLLMLLPQDSFESRITTLNVLVDYTKALWLRPRHAFGTMSNECCMHLVLYLCDTMQQTPILVGLCLRYRSVLSKAWYIVTVLITLYTRWSASRNTGSFTSHKLNQTELAFIWCMYLHVGYIRFPLKIEIKTCNILFHS